MTDLERIARAEERAEDRIAAALKAAGLNADYDVRLSYAAAALAAMREEIERLTQYMKGRIEGAEEITRHAVADRDHWKAECERLREVVGGNTA